MNINLISPEKNGHSFNVRFKEDIIIPENSKVYLNFAELQRESELVFIQDQRVQLDLDSEQFIIYPTHETGGSTGANFRNMNDHLFTRNEFTFAKDVLSYSEFVEKFSAGIENILRGNNVDGSAGTANNGKLDHYRACDLSDLRELQDLNGNQGIVSGICRSVNTTTNQTNRHTRFTIDPAQSRNCDATGMDYRKTSADQTQLGAFDNYALSTTPMNHVNYIDNTPMKEANFLQFRTNKSIDAMLADAVATIAADATKRSGRLNIGVHSKGVIEGLNVGGAGEGAFPADDAFRTNGNNATNSAGNPNPRQFPTAGATSKPDLAMFVNVIIDCSDGTNQFLKIKTASFNTGAAAFPIGFARSQQEHIVTMTTNRFSNQEKYLDLSSIMNGHTDTPFMGGLYFYEEQNHLTNREKTRTYFMVLNLTNGYDAHKSVFDQPEIIIYDSRISGINRCFQERFFATTDNTKIDYTTGTDADKIRKLKTQAYPFHVMCGSLTQNDGWGLIEYTKVDDSDDTKPPIRIPRYVIRTDQQLANYLNLPVIFPAGEPRGLTPINQVYFPDSLDFNSSNFNFKRNLELDWRSISYSIFINGLPIKSFKNTSNIGSNNASATGRSGGYSKAIIANIPAPFRESVEFSGDIKKLISAVYEPSYQIMNNLYNQSFTTNNFDIEIKRMSDDSVATEIDKCIINFTILPPDSYKGNINTVAALKM